MVIVLCRLLGRYTGVFLHQFFADRKVIRANGKSLPDSFAAADPFCSEYEVNLFLDEVQRLNKYASGEISLDGYLGDTEANWRIE